MTITNCIRCGEASAIRDVHGYSLDQVNEYLGLGRPLIRAKDGWAVYYCLPCAKTWLFPLIDARCGNTTDQILADFQADEAKHVVSPGRTVEDS